MPVFHPSHVPPESLSAEQHRCDLRIFTHIYRRAHGMFRCNNESCREITGRQHHRLSAFRDRGLTQQPALCRGMRATISGDEGKGFIKLIVAKDTDKLVGAHLVGPEVGEIMQVPTHPPPPPALPCPHSPPLWPHTMCQERPTSCATQPCRP